MRLQYALICHEFLDGDWEGATNLVGVRHKLLGSYQPSDLPAGEDPETARKPPLPIKLVLSLIEGAVGPHHVWAGIRRPGGEMGDRLPPMAIEWDEASPTFFVIYEISFHPYENGTYEFTVLVDGEPLGSVPLPVEMYALPV